MSLTIRLFSGLALAWLVARAHAITSDDEGTGLCARLLLNESAAQTPTVAGLVRSAGKIVASLDDEDLARRMAIWSDRRVHDRGYLPGLSGEPGEAKTFAELTESPRELLSVYSNLTSVLVVRLMLIGHSVASPPASPEMLSDTLDVLTFHEVVKRRLQAREHDPLLKQSFESLEEELRAASPNDVPHYRK